MKISSIHIYSHDGQQRNLRFKVNGLNVITGRSSTGKSALSEIIDIVWDDPRSTSGGRHTR